MIISVIIIEDELITDAAGTRIINRRVQNP
jgi:hypothetical protein